MLLHQHYVPHARGWDGHRSAEGICSFFRKLFPFFFKRAARIATKPLIKTVVRGAKTVGKKAIKSANKHGIKKVLKEVAKDGVSEIANRKIAGKYRYFFGQSKTKGSACTRYRYGDSSYQERSTKR